MPAIRRRSTAADVRALTLDDQAWPRYELIADELLVTPGPASKHQLLLAVEVLSLSSMHSDRTRKRDFYLENGVEEYWIIDLDARVVERWLRAQETPELLRETIVWTPRARRPLVIELPAYFSRIDKKARMFDRPRGAGLTELVP